MLTIANLTHNYSSQQNNVKKTGGNHQAKVSKSESLKSESISEKIHEMIQEKPDQHTEIGVLKLKLKKYQLDNFSMNKQLKSAQKQLKSRENKVEKKIDSKPGAKNEPKTDQKPGSKTQLSTENTLKQSIISSHLAIVVPSARSNIDRRTVIRETWAKNLKNVIFVVGKQHCKIPTKYRKFFWECEYKNPEIEDPDFKGNKIEELMNFDQEEMKRTEDLTKEENVVLVDGFLDTYHNFRDGEVL